MSTVILACSTLEEYVDAAQQKMQTDYPLVLLDKKYHVEPKDMRQHIIETMQTLDPDVDTVLVAMGFCGGSWDNLSFDRRLVFPVVDDCVTILLHTDDTRHANLKKAGHLYAISEDAGFSPTTVWQEMHEKYEGWKADILFDMWFENYRYLDVVDTGVYDCKGEAFLKQARKDAELIKSEMGFVSGSNRIIEKLVSGKWDSQFLVLEPGRVISQWDFIV